MKSIARAGLAVAVLSFALLACGPSPSTPTATDELSTATREPPSPTPTTEPPTPTAELQATLLPVDATWGEYVNERLGFAIRVPHTAF